jgi:hypothetical protein
MLTFSMPVSLGPDELWIFVQYGALQVGLARLATHVEHLAVVAFPVEFVDTTAIVPVSRITGDPMNGLRWATVADLSDYPTRFPRADRIA